MGLDISFNRELAINAGIEIQMIANDGCYDDTDDLEYIEWCKSSSECIKVPGMEFWVTNDGVDNIVVRANKWGNTYTPLTDWLKTHNIEWDEF